LIRAAIPPRRDPQEDIKREIKRISLQKKAIKGSDPLSHRIAWRQTLTGILRGIIPIIAFLVVVIFLLFIIQLIQWLKLDEYIFRPEYGEPNG
jgi:hypothetical protein